MNTYSKPDVVFTKGSGVFLYDTTGKQYLDFMAGIAVTSLGHSDALWVSTLNKQAQKLVHASNYYHSEATAQLAYGLVCHSQFDKAFICNSGTEANEAALKFARKWGREKGDPGNHSKVDYVAFKHGFSGRSMGALSCTHKAKYREPYMPLIQEVHFATFNDLDSAASVMTDNVCAVLVEPIQGEGGVNPASLPFLRGLRELCTKHKALMIVDEVQCGLGRTGRLWAHEAYGIKPDMMTLAKPLANGLPIGAVLVTDEVANVIHPGDHGTTFGGNALACTMAKHVFDRLAQPQFLADVRSKGDYLLQRLKAIKSDHIREIRSAGGLFVGVEFDVSMNQLIQNAMNKGVLFVNAGDNVLRLCPALIIEREHISKGMDILEECIALL